MKVLLSYGNYFNQGKKYHAQFTYDSLTEAEQVESCINSLGCASLGPYQERITKGTQSTSVIRGINIPKEVLLPFIHMLLALENATVVIGSQKFTKNNAESIEESIDSLHINVTLQKGKYFSFGDCYYVKFRYASDEQRAEVSYDFNVNLIANRAPTIGNDSYLFPYIVDRFGKMTLENTGIIGGTNIPKQALPFFLKKFVNEYNAILTIGNEKFRDSIDNERLLPALQSLDPELGRARTRKPRKNNKAKKEV